MDGWMDGCIDVIDEDDTERSICNSILCKDGCIYWWDGKSTDGWMDSVLSCMVRCTTIQYSMVLLVRSESCVYHWDILCIWCIYSFSTKDDLYTVIFMLSGSHQPWLMVACFIFGDYVNVATVMTLSWHEQALAKLLLLVYSSVHRW
jgi:hypothetical protein